MIRIFALLLLLPLCARAEDLYRIRPLSETEIVDTYISIMRDACRHAGPYWRDWPAIPNSGFWDSGHSDENGFRHIEGMTLVTAALVKYDATLPETERAEYKRKLLAAFRYVTATHVTGPRKCSDGKHWGNANPCVLERFKKYCSHLKLAAGERSF